MIEFIFLAGAALSAINQASPEARHDRQIKAYKEGRISKEQVQKNIQEIWMNPYFEGDPNDFSDIRRDEANWNAYIKKHQAEREKFQSLDVDGKYAFMSDRIKSAFNRGDIDRDTASQQLTQLKEWRRNNS